MKTLSISQPYATLIAVGAKKIETRSWYTLYRGPLAIHAAKGFPKWARSICGEPRFHEALWRAGYELGVQSSDCLPVGAIVATCRLVDCKRIVTNAHMFNVTGASSAYRASNELAPPGQPELSFGDYAHGRYAWMLEDVVRMLEPIPAKGALGLWEWDGAATP